MSLIVSLLLLATLLGLSILLDNGKESVHEYCMLECVGYMAYSKKHGMNGYMY